jgi:integrase
MARKTNVEINGKKYYRIYPTVELADGTKVRRQFYGDCKSDAEAERDKFIEEQKRIRNEGLASVGGTVLIDSIKEWIYDVIRLDSSLKPTSFERYEGIYRNYLKTAEIGSKSLSEITKLDIKMYYNKLYENGGLTKSQIYHIQKVLRKFFFYCIEHEMITKNPCSNISLPGNKEYDDVEIEIFTDDEMDRIKEAIKEHPYRLLILFAFSTGMRLGELLALRHRDISDGIVTVSWSLSEHSVIDAKGKRKTVVELMIPKSKTSLRNIPLPKSMLELYTAGDPDDFLFLTSGGKHINESSFRKAWIRILKKAGVPYRKFHCCRHTYITKLVQNGANLAVVKELAGHSDIKMTMRYTHINMKDKNDAIKLIDSIAE